MQGCYKPDNQLGKHTQLFFYSSSRTQLHTDRQQGLSAKQRSLPQTHGTNALQRQGATNIHGGGFAANSRTLACIKLFAYFFFPLPPLFSKNFCMFCAVGILDRCRGGTARACCRACLCFLLRTNEGPWPLHSAGLSLNLSICSRGLWNRSRLGGTSRWLGCGAGLGL